MNNEIKEREKKFHNKRFSNDPRKSLDRYYQINNESKAFFFNLVSSKLENNKVKMLDYGCGDGDISLKFLEYTPPELYAFDISEVAIKKLKKKVDTLNEVSRIRLSVMDAQQTGFKSNSFDLVVGVAILHHLDIEKASMEIVRILNFNGEAIFFEPLGHNIFINFYRKLTPKLRSIDEHPLRMEDFKILETYFEKVECYYFNFITLFSLIFLKTSFFSLIFKFFKRIDEKVIKLKCFQKYSWIVIIKLSNPKKLKSN